MKRAVLDIGSNSVRLMLWADGKTLYKKVLTTRLAEGAAGELGEIPMQRTLQAILELFRTAAREGAEVCAFATAAVRANANGGEFCRRVRAACGLEVDVLSGKEEAEAGLCGALGEKDGGIVDLGGASTEVCVRRGGKIAAAVSIPLGCVKLYAQCREVRAELGRTIGEALLPLEGVNCPPLMYAVGGTAATLASVKLGLAEYDAALLHGLALSRAWLGETAELLLPMTHEARKGIPGMDPRRADVIAGGALLLAEVLKKLSVREVLFSDRDNLEGYLSMRGLA